MGTQAFQLATQISYEPGVCIVEVGSEHGGGSTQYLAEFAAVNDIEFYSIDVDPHITDRITGWPGVTAINGEAEAVLKDWPHEKIMFAWLDGYDWPYSFFPGTPEQVAAYASRGRYITREDSQLSHLTIAKYVHEHTGPGAIAAFDDTWPLPDGDWSGKGGTAVPWMLDNGWQLVRCSAPVEEPAGGLGYVILGRDA